MKTNNSEGMCNAVAGVKELRYQQGQPRCQGLGSFVIGCRGCLE